MTSIAKARDDSALRIPEPTAAGALGYRPALDGLRAVCILSVMVFHSAFLRRYLPGGFLGVDVFFVLSGFLITTLLLEEKARNGHVNLRSFYFRRALRLLPALFVLLASLWLVKVLLGRYFKTDTRLLVESTLSICFYASNWVMAFGQPWPAALGHMWSLSVEEQFYLVWPLLLLWMLRPRNARSLPVWALSLSVLAVAIWRSYLWETTHLYGRCYFATDTRADAILIGCLFAILRSYGWLRYRSALAKLAAICLAAALLLGDNSIGQMFYGGFTAAASVAGLVIVELVNKPRSILTLPLLRWTGRLSYGLYLWHNPVYYLVEKSSLKFHAGIGLPTEFVVTFCCTACSFYFFEQPMLGLKGKFSTLAKPPVRAGMGTHSDSR